MFRSFRTSAPNWQNWALELLGIAAPSLRHFASVQELGRSISLITGPATYLYRPRPACYVRNASSLKALAFKVKKLPPDSSSSSGDEDEPSLRTAPDPGAFDTEQPEVALRIAEKAVWAKLPKGSFANIVEDSQHSLREADIPAPVWFVLLELREAGEQLHKCCTNHLALAGTKAAIKQYRLKLMSRWLSWLARRLLQS